MRQIVWSSRAEQEYLSIISYWNNRNKSTSYSKKLVVEVQRKENLILDNPEIHSAIYYNELRRILVFEDYSIIYKISGSIIYVVAFWDNRRNPDSLNL